MKVHHLAPILNVSNLVQSFEWFEKLGWQKTWDWGSPPTFGPGSNEALEKGVWLSMWVDDVDEVHRRCLKLGLEVTWPPTDMAWNTREMHVRHPDGHVFRISKGIGGT